MIEAYRNVVVMKFGGTSVTGPSALKRLVELVKRRSGTGRFVVVSAFAGVTNQLSRLVDHIGDWQKVRRTIEELRRFHHQQVFDLDLPETEALQMTVDELIGELYDVASHGNEDSAALRDHLQSFGERLSSTMISRVLEHAGETVHLLDARMLMATNDNFGEAVPDRSKTLANLREYVSPLLKSNCVVLTQGFIGCSPQGLTTTLGRGGSDSSAALFASLLPAQEAWIYSDVDGVLGADPNLIQTPHLLRNITHAQANQLCRLGARVLHPSTIEALGQQPLTLYVANTFADQPCTRIGSPNSDDPPVFAVAGRDVHFQRMDGTFSDLIQYRALDRWLSTLLLREDPLFLDRSFSLDNSLDLNQVLGIVGILCPESVRQDFLQQLAETRLPVLLTSRDDTEQPIYLATQPACREALTRTAYQLLVDDNPKRIGEERHQCVVSSLA